MNIGYIGLGLMGAACTKNLLKHNHTLFVWARRPQSCTELENLGATVCATPADVAKKVDILFTNVTDSPDVEDLLFRADGIAATPKKGLIVVDMSTISAIKSREFSARLEALGMEFVDAPVSGGTSGAQKGTLTIMVGAKENTFAFIKPVLLAMGTTVTRIGSAGAGQVAKSCNQICITANLIGVGEAMDFAKANDVDFTPIREALMGGIAASNVLEWHGEHLIRNDFTPGFKSYLHLKDMNIVKDIAVQKNIKAPTTALGIELLKLAVQDEKLREEDSRAIVKLLQKV